MASPSEWKLPPGATCWDRKLSTWHMPLTCQPVPARLRAVSGVCVSPSLRLPAGKYKDAYPRHSTQGAAMAMSSMLRGKGGQPQQGSYQPLPGRSSSPPNANPPLERKTSAAGLRKVSPGPDQTKRILDRPLNTNARVTQPSINRTIAPGQVSLV